MTFFASIESQRCPGKPVCDSAEICSIAIFVNIQYLIDRKTLIAFLRCMGIYFLTKRGPKISWYCPFIVLFIPHCHWFTHFIVALSLFYKVVIRSLFLAWIFWWEVEAGEVELTGQAGDPYRQVAGPAVAVARAGGQGGPGHQRFTTTSCAVQIFQLELSLAEKVTSWGDKVIDAKSKCRLSYFGEKLQHTDFNSLSEMCLSLHGVEEAQGGGGGFCFVFKHTSRIMT